MASVAERGRPPVGEPLGRRNLLILGALAAAAALAQCTSVFVFHGDRVDEAEVVAFAVGFFGGDLDPVSSGSAVRFMTPFLPPSRTLKLSDHLNLENMRAKYG